MTKKIKIGEKKSKEGDAKRTKKITLSLLFLLEGSMKRVTVFSLLYLAGVVWQTDRWWTRVFLWGGMALFDTLFQVLIVGGQYGDIGFNTLFLGVGLIIGQVLDILPLLRVETPRPRKSEAWPSLLVYLVMVISDSILGVGVDEFIPVVVANWFLIAVFTVRGVWGEDVLYAIVGSMIAAPIVNFGTWTSGALLGQNHEQTLYGSDHHWWRLGDEVMTVLYIVISACLGTLSIILLPRGKFDANKSKQLSSISLENGVYPTTGPPPPPYSSGIAIRKRMPGTGEIPLTEWKPPPVALSTTEFLPVGMRHRPAISPPSAFSHASMSSTSAVVASAGGTDVLGGLQWPTEFGGPAFQF